jgi:hypothetical protein
MRRRIAVQISLYLNNAPDPPLSSVPPDHELAQQVPSHLARVAIIKTLRKRR